MRVQAAPGRTVPMEDNPRKHIGQKAVDVTASTYYRRRVAAGDLVEVPASAGAAPASTTAEASTPATKSTTKRTRGSDA